MPSDDLDHVLRHTSALWPKAAGARFFITGGTGFFGHWLLESLFHASDRLDLGITATVLTRFPRRSWHPGLTYHVGAIETFPFPRGNFTHLIHAANCPGIIPGTARVLDLAFRAGIRNILLTSSGAVYGTQPPGLPGMNEDFGCRPATPYGEGKHAVEDLCRDHGHYFGASVKLARCFTFIGPHLPLDGQFAAGRFLASALRGEPICVANGGTPVRSYLYASDLAIWLWTILFSGYPGRAYNVGSDAPITIADLAAAVGRAASVPVNISPFPPPPSAFPLPSSSVYLPDITRARHELGLEVRIPPDEAIRRTLAWLA